VFKLYEERLNKINDQKRAELGNYQFLTRYIKKYSRSIKVLKLLQIPIIILNLIAGICYIILYYLTADLISIITGILVTITGIIWIVNYIAYRYHHFAFIQSKIDSWKEELTIINESK
jgi:membrane protein YdbS with pleckstrin-like domain